MAVPGIEDYFFKLPGQWDIYRCGGIDCGVGWISPSPSDRELAAAYKNYYTHAAPKISRAEVIAGNLVVRWVRRFGAQLPAIPFLFREFENRLLDGGGLYPDPNGVVVDVGCGAGQRLDYFKKLGWGRVIGIESDPVAVERGVAQGFDIRLGSAEDTQIGASSTDVIFMHHVIEHVRDPRAALREAARILKLGASIVITTPNIDSEGAGAWSKFWRGYEAPRHLHIFTLSALRRLLEEAGFVVTLGRTSARGRPFMDAASRSVSARTTRQRSGSLRNIWRGDQLVMQGQRAIARHGSVGEELFVVARKR